MSSQLVLFDAGSIEMLYDADNLPWFKRAHIGKFLGLSHVITSIQDEMKREQHTRSELEEGSYGRSKNHHDAFINFDAVKYILCKSSKPAAITLAKELGIDVLGTKCLRKEQDTLSSILTTFHGGEMIDQ